MNRIVLVLILLSSIIVYGQTRVPFVTDSVAIYADSLTQQINVGTNMFAGSLFIPANIDDSIFVDIYNTSTGYTPLHSAGVAYVLKNDSSVATFMVLDPDVFGAIKKFRLRWSSDIADTQYFVFDKRGF